MRLFTVVLALAVAAWTQAIASQPLYKRHTKITKEAEFDRGCPEYRHRGVKAPTRPKHCWVRWPLSALESRVRGIGAKRETHKRTFIQITSSRPTGRTEEPPCAARSLVVRTLGSHAARGNEHGAMMKLRFLCDPYRCFLAVGSPRDGRRWTDRGAQPLWAEGDDSSAGDGA
jgi:hypothetical protein